MGDAGQWGTRDNEGQRTKWKEEVREEWERENVKEAKRVNQ